jgi:Flp pilus assembly protein TadB
MSMQALAMAFLAFTTVGGLAWVFIYPSLSGEKKVEQRRAAISRSEPAIRQADKSQRSRREQVEGSLKEVEARRQKAKKVALSVRITQAGLNWTTKKFIVISSILAAVTFAITLIMTYGGDAATSRLMVDGQSTLRSIDLGIGKSVVIDMRRDITNIQATNPKIVNAIVRAPQQVYITGASEGQTSIAFFSTGGQKIATYEIAVGSPGIGGILAAFGLAFATGFGLPRWVLNFLKKRREKAFLRSLPDAVDVIVRGIKAGLPLFDSIKVVAADATEPLKSEFLAIIETQTIGMPLGDACARLYERMPVPEANFFGIVVAIQQKSGGNLSEALGNLSKVLRDRKKMAEKIQAMSMEAKASAGIIGSLPPIVMVLVYLSTPDYMSLLWTEPTGRLMLAGSALWMTAGIFVMKKMINFDF